MLSENVSWSAVFLQSWLRTIVSSSPFFISTTIRIPSRSLSSRTSATPTTFSSFTRSAIFSMIFALFWL